MRSVSNHHRRRQQLLLWLLVVLLSPPPLHRHLPTAVDMKVEKLCRVPRVQWHILVGAVEAAPMPTAGVRPAAEILTTVATAAVLEDPADAP